jgi:hypothetical protein
MQHIPDKEFDKLFKDKFNDAEIEPSANLWANIEKELVPKRKRIIPVYWMAAASVLIVISAMLVFQKTDKIQLRVEQQQANTITTVEEGSLPTNVIEQPTVETKIVNSNKSFVAKVSTQEAVEDNLDNQQLAMQPIKETERLPIKQQEVMQLAIVPIKETVIENPIVIAQVIPKQEVESNTISETDNFSERKGIRNVGDLVNFVVDKVDKRDKKILKFNTDDDDNSSLVALNIGFLKFNKKNR